MRHEIRGLSHQLLNKSELFTISLKSLDAKRSMVLGKSNREIRDYLFSNHN